MMKEPRILKALDGLRPIFALLRVDYPAMRRILGVKLLMDTRRVPVVIGNQTRKKQKESNLFFKSLWVYALTGLFITPINFLHSNYLFKTSLVFGIILFMVMTSMIADFSSVLLDTRDQTILKTKPIAARTLHAAKTVHICIYLLMLTGALGLPSALAELIQSGPLFFLLFLFCLVLTDLTAISCTTFIYLLVLKFFDGERLKDMINYVQIFLTFAVTIGYQLLVRAFDITVGTITLLPAWWHFIVPPLWFGGLAEWLIGGNHAPYISLLAASGVLMPLALFLGYLGFSGPFERIVMKLSAQAGKSRHTFGRISRFFGVLLCRGREERLFFRFTSMMIKQDRMFKLKVYPALGMALILPLILMMNSVQIYGWASVRSSANIYYIYFSLLTLPNALALFKRSSAYKGAWIYGTAPIASRRAIITGMLKAMLVQLFLPVYLLLAALSLFLFHWSALADLLAVLPAAFLFAVINYVFYADGSLPFSVSFDSALKNNNGLVTLFLFVIGALFAAMHAAFRSTLPGYGLLLYIALLLAANVIVWKAGIRT